MFQSSLVLLFFCFDHSYSEQIDCEHRKKVKGRLMRSSRPLNPKHLNTMKKVKNNMMMDMLLYIQHGLVNRIGCFW